MFEKEEIKKLFNENEAVTVTFTKKNGEERVMHCTTNLDHIPEDLHPIIPKVKKIMNEETMKVFDFDKQEWRSFRFDSITKVEV